MLEIFKLTYSIALPCLVGHQILTFITRKQPLPYLSTFSISFGLGFGILTQTMLIIGALNFEYTIFNISAILILIYGIFLLLSKFRKTSSVPRHSHITKKLYLRSGLLSITVKITILTIISYYLFYSFWAAINIPVYTWDSVATCIYNAKIIYFDNSLKSFQYFAHPTYPLHIPMITAWISFNLGQWNDQIFKIFFPLTFICFAFIYNDFLASRTTKNWASLGILMLFSSNLLILHSTIAYRDLSLMFYNCSVIIFLLIWKDQKADAFLILASLFSGFSTFVKQEGVAYFSIHVVVMLFILLRYKSDKIKGKIQKFLKFLIPSLGIFSLFYFYKIAQGIPTTAYLHFKFPLDLRHVMLVFRHFCWALFFTANWNIFWSFLIISIFLNYKKIRNESNILTLLLTIALFLGLLISLSILSGNDYITHYLDISRLILQFFPLCPLTIILLIHSKK